MGDRIVDPKEGSDLRVFLQNPNGVIGNLAQLYDRSSLLSLREWDVNVIALLETNRNWKMVD